jgi:hypothetical protein
VLESGYSFDFHILKGDANGDRAVGDLDLYRVWQNLSKAPASRDLNDDLTGDGQVTANDLDVVRENYLKRLAPLSQLAPEADASSNDDNSLPRVKAASAEVRLPLLIHPAEFSSPVGFSNLPFSGSLAQRPSLFSPASAALTSFLNPFGDGSFRTLHYASQLPGQVHMDEPTDFLADEDNEGSILAEKL